MRNAPPSSPVGRGIHTDALVSEITAAGGKVRLFVEEPLGEDVRVALSATQSHYILHVMRARIGDRVDLFNGRDGEWLAGIAEAARRLCSQLLPLRQRVHGPCLLVRKAVLTMTNAG